MGSLQTSHVVTKVITLKGPMLVALRPTIMVADDGRDGERGLGGSDPADCRENWCASGRRACVQLRPWFTQSLQKPLEDTESAIEALVKMFHADTGMKTNMPPRAHSLPQKPLPVKWLRGK